MHYLHYLPVFIAGSLFTVLLDRTLTARRLRKQARVIRYEQQIRDRTVAELRSKNSHLWLVD